MDPLTLETNDDYYTFGGKLESQTLHRASEDRPADRRVRSPSATRRRASPRKDIDVFSADKDGKVNWGVRCRRPTPAMIHDFAVTQRHVVLLVTPMAANLPQMQAGGVHFA